MVVATDSEIISLISSKISMHTSFERKQFHYWIVLPQSPRNMSLSRSLVWINVLVLFSLIIVKWHLWKFCLPNFNISRSMGPFPAGVILHSYLGSAEMVPEFSKLGAYFSFSGFLMSLKANKAKKMLKMVIFITSYIWLMLNIICTINFKNSDILILSLFRSLLIGFYWRQMHLMHYQCQT